MGVRWNVGYFASLGYGIALRGDRRLISDDNLRFNIERFVVETIASIIHSTLDYNMQLLSTYM
jgi:hypothetical protein